MSDRFMSGAGFAIGVAIAGTLFAIAYLVSKLFA